MVGSPACGGTDSDGIVEKAIGKPVVDGAEVSTSGEAMQEVQGVLAPLKLVQRERVSKPSVEEKLIGRLHFAGALAGVNSSHLFSVTSPRAVAAANGPFIDGHTGLSGSVKSTNRRVAAANGPFIDGHEPNRSNKRR